MAYQGFCMKYGQGTVLLSTSLLGSVSQVSLMYAVGATVYFPLAFITGLTAGLCGVFAGSAVEPFMNRYLAKARVGTTEGAQAMKRAQLVAGVAGISAFSLAFALFAKKIDSIKGEKPAADKHAKVATIQKRATGFNAHFNTGYGR